MGVYNPLAKMPRACGECEDRYKCKYADMTIPRRSDDCPLVEEPNLVINPEEVAEGRVIEIGEDIIVMHHKDYYDLLCEQFKVEPCEDAISRAEALKFIDEKYNDGRHLSEYEDGSNSMNETIYAGIESLPSVAPSRPKGEWIPCSERLPEKYGNYLVSIEDMVRACYYQRDGWDYYEPDAWQPLPKPWKGADDEQ